MQREVDAAEAEQNHANINNDEGIIINEMDSDMLEENDDDIPSTKRLKISISAQALKTLHDLRCNNVLCDAVISVADDCFNVHRAIISSCSSYFR